MEVRHSNQRYDWLDTTRALGMFLVYYGHIVEQVYRSGSSHAFSQFKLIYSFHMALFFFIAGFFWKLTSPRFIDRLKLLALRRYVPVLAFGCLLIPLWVLSTWWTGGDWRVLRHMVFSYPRGGPGFNVLTWFLICLFSCEVLAGLVLPRLKIRWTAGLFGTLSLLAGLFICRHVGDLTGFGTSPKTMYLNAWYLPESVVALGFYAFGFACFPLLTRITTSHSWLPYAAVPVSCLALLFTYGLNVPHEGFVDMAVSDHGQIAPFITSAAAGICLMLALGKIVPKSKILAFVGKNSLIYLGFNGIFFHFLNQRLVAWWAPGFDALNVTSFCLAVTLLSMITCAPFAMLANRYIPQLVGELTRPDLFYRHLTPLPKKFRMKGQAVPSRCNMLPKGNAILSTIKIAVHRPMWNRSDEVPYRP